MMDALFNGPLIHRSLLDCEVLYCSFIAKRRFVANCCIVVPRDVNMYHIAPTSTDTSTSTSTS